MKTTLVLVALMATVFVTSATYNRGTMKPNIYINRPTMPKPRYRRDAKPEDGGSLTISGQKHTTGPERRPAYNVDYQHDIWHNKNGHISAGGGAQKLPGQRWEPQVGIRGTFRFRREAQLDEESEFESNAEESLDNHQSADRFRREANPQNRGSISVTAEKPLSGPERRPSYNINYQHKIWQGKNGHISAGGGAQKLPGQRWEPQVGVRGVWRFRREAHSTDEDNEAENNVEESESHSGDRRFRRQANPQNRGSVTVTAEKPMSGPERRPSYKIDYQHNIWQGKNGQISAGGGAQKLPGQRWEPQVGVRGVWRFRREAKPQNGHGSISGTYEKPMSGPERRPSYKLDYQHNIYQGKRGEISAGGGIQKMPGHKVEPQVGIQGRLRF